MEFNHVRITTMRPFTTVVQKVKYRGVEAIAYSPKGKKIQVSSELIFPLPLLDEDKQMKELVQDVYVQLLIEEKKFELFYSGINEPINPIKSRR